jgi:hypothetical protein
LIDTLKNLKTRAVFVPTQKGKQRQERIDLLRNKDIKKILERDERILKWWNDI